MRLSTSDIKISYIDSDDDLIPVDNELDFKECLKFSRIRARCNKRILMKVGMVSNGGAKPKESLKFDNISVQTKPKLFCLKKRDIADKKKYVSFEKGNDNKKGTDVPPEWFENYMTKV